MTGFISHVQRFSLHDGPGARTTVFFMGCPLRCLWCHNPETLESRPFLTYEESKCIRCLGCVGACGTGALTVSPEAGLTHDKEKCARCFRCVADCPSNALRKNGGEIEAKTLMDELLPDRGIYEKTGGGITFSGGEATMQSGFLAELLDLCKKEGLRTAIDTCGMCDAGIFLELCRKTDLVLLDLKHMDSDRHRKLTGAANERIIQNALLLSEHNIKVQIRIPVIPAYNDDEENFDATARFVGGLANVESVVLLGYHKLGLGKACGFGARQSAPDIEIPSKAHMRALCERMQRQIPDIPVTFR